jgi:ribonuclease HI
VFLGASVLVDQGISDPATLEAMACWEALSLALDLHVKVHVASDCLVVINSLNGDYRGRFSSITHEITFRRADSDAVSFAHERRRNYTEAHGLARASVSRSTGRYVWLIHSPDEFCILIFRVD